MSPVVAQNGHGVMSAMSPVCSPKADIKVARDDIRE